MRRLLPWLPILLTACSSNVMGVQALGGPMGRFGHSLTREPALATAAPDTPPPAIASVPTPTPTPRTLVATPFPITPPPTPWPTQSPPPPTPTPTPVPVVLLTPEPTPTPGPTYGLGAVRVNRRYLWIYVRDNAAEDGDRVRIELNGEVMVADLTLTNGWTPLSFDLRAGTNRLRWVALNEGEVSPNTFEIYLHPDQLVTGSANQNSTFLLTGESDTLTVIAP